MAEHNQTGKKGENIALQLLHHKGYTILKSNWRFGRTEIDIIADKNGLLVFVEVKTRTSDAFGDPALAVTPRKEQLLYEAAGAFMEQHKREGAFRFDIISVTLHKDGFPDITHYEDAFYPGSNLDD